MGWASCHEHTIDARNDRDHSFTGGTPGLPGGSLDDLGAGAEGLLRALPGVLSVERDGPGGRPSHRIVHVALRRYPQVRQRGVWVVFDNYHRPTKTFEYTQRKEADAYAAQMTAEKKSTYFVRLVKEEIKG